MARWATLWPLTLVASLAGAPSGVAGERPPRGPAAVPGVKVGHHTLEERPTGCTVVLVEGGAVGGVDVRGGGPGTRETALLDPSASVEVVHAVVLSGGSAFGLDAAGGVVRYLEEKGVGYPTSAAKVPIVPAAILYDLSVGDNPGVRPGPDCGFKAAQAASTGSLAEGRLEEGRLQEGSIGAGAGASVGKLRGMARAMKGGVGMASIELENGLIVAALVAVYSVGDVVDPATGEVVAGVREEDGSGLSDARRLLSAGAIDRDALRGRDGENTTLGVVVTNAPLTKAQTQKIAQMAQDGVARATYPAHTPWDGDTIFALATGDWVGAKTVDGKAVDGKTVDSSVVATVGALAADMVVESILRAVRLAEGLPGLPSVTDLATAADGGPDAPGEKP